jgi:rod shape-determining protein MreD
MLMRWIRFAILVCLATIIQAGLNKFTLVPDLHIILLVFFAVYSTTADAIITSFIIGFAADLVGPSMGTKMLSFLIIGTALAYLNRVFSLKQIPYQVISIFVTVILIGALSNILNSLKNVGTIEYGTILKTAIVSSIAGPFLFPPARWLMSLKAKHHHRKI